MKKSGEVLAIGRIYVYRDGSVQFMGEAFPDFSPSNFTDVYIIKRENVERRKR